MATLKLKKPAFNGNRNAPREPRPPIRGAGSAPRKRPSEAEARAERENREARNAQQRAPQPPQRFDEPRRDAPPRQRPPYQQADQRQDRPPYPQQQRPPQQRRTESSRDSRGPVGSASRNPFGSRTRDDAGHQPQEPRRAPPQRQQAPQHPQPPVPRNASRNPTRNTGRGPGHEPSSYGSSRGAPRDAAPDPYRDPSQGWDARPARHNGPPSSPPARGGGTLDGGRGGGFGSGSSARGDRGDRGRGPNNAFEKPSQRRVLPPARPTDPRRPPEAQRPPAAALRRNAYPAHKPQHDDDDDDDVNDVFDNSHDDPTSIRLSKRMSALGLASRREADEWIAKGWVRVDGRTVSELGSRVTPDMQITVDERARFQQAQRVTILINKPVGYVSGQAEDGYRPASVLITPENQWKEDISGTRYLHAHLRGLAPAGRLDIDSVGLLVLTQDGRIAKQLIGQDRETEKEYLVRVEKPVDGLSDADLALLRHGLELDGEPLLPALVEWINDDQLRFVLKEGKKRQIRRMCEAVGLKVVGLKRVRIGKVMLGDLPVGQWRYLGVYENFV